MPVETGCETRVAGVLLAAGASTRMGTGSKLLLPLGGLPLVRHAGRNLLEAGLAPVVAVLGHDGEAVREALSGLGLRFVRNPAPGRGMASSLVAGVASLGPGAGGVVVALGDMPRLAPATIRAVADAIARGPAGIVVPTFGGRRGHPVAFDLRRYRGELLDLTGDQGARAVLARHGEDLLEVPVEDPGVVLDVDTPEAYRDLVGRD